MGVQISNTSATAPEFEDGLQEARFDGLSAESHPEWATENGKYGKDDGERLRFDFTAFDGKEILYVENGKGETVPFEINALTSTAMGKNSRFTAYMSGILTASEQALIKAGQTVDSDSINGRMVLLVLSHNENGWPKVDAVIPAKPVKGAKAKPVAAAVAAEPVDQATATDASGDEEALAAAIAAAKAKKLAALQAELAALEA